MTDRAHTDEGYEERILDAQAAAAEGAAEEERWEGPLCPSCDGAVAENAITCPCGAVVDEERFWVDPFPGLTFQERMDAEAALEMEERGYR